MGTLEIGILESAGITGVTKIGTIQEKQKCKSTMHIRKGDSGLWNIFSGEAVVFLREFMFFCVSLCHFL